MPSENMENAVPEPSPDGLQVNFCKTPSCPNFGVPAFVENRNPGRPRKDQPSGGSTYTKGPNWGTNPNLRCTLCGKTFALKSNLGISEEMSRLFSFRPQPLTCRNKNCANYQTVSVEAGPDFYYKHGPAANGSARFQCRLCKRTVVVPTDTIAKQHQSHKNKRLFDLLVGKMAMRQICRHLHINGATLYDKIDFLYKRCLSFLWDRERKLHEGMALDRLRLSVDQQELTINWPSRDVRKNVRFKHLAAADNESRYVFGGFLNYDADVDNIEMEGLANAVDPDTGKRDVDIAPPFRRYARAWLLDEYEAEASTRGEQSLEQLRVAKERALAEFAHGRGSANAEGLEFPSIMTQLPAKGIQVHNDYTMYAFFQYLRKVFSGVEKVCFSLDEDSGLLHACLTGFCQEIKDEKCDVFLVKVNKSLTVDEREVFVDRCWKRFNELKRSNPQMKDFEIRLIMLREAFEHRIRTKGRRWLAHPMVTKFEAEKRSALLTDIGQYADDLDHLLNLHNLASQKAVDLWFEYARRRISEFERGIDTASKRRWNAYNTYDPQVAVKLLTISKAYYNYCECSEDDGKTPAQRLGMSKGPVKMEDIIYGRKFGDYSFTNLAKEIKQEKYTEEQAEKARKKVQRQKRSRYKHLVKTLEPERVVYLSTIIDGVADDERIIEIAIADHAGNFLLNKLVNPGRPLLEDAHGITDRVLAGKPRINKLKGALKAALAGKMVVSFDSKFDTTLYPIEVVRCIDRYETYLDFHRTLLDKRGVPRGIRNLKSLEATADLRAYQWQGQKNRAASRALALRFIWYRLTEWDIRSRLKQKKAGQPQARQTTTAQQTPTRAPAVKASSSAPPAPKAGPQTAVATVSKKPVSPAAQPHRQPSPVAAPVPPKVFLDFETTGLDTEHDQIVQVGIVDEQGKVLVNELVMPTREISEGAIKVHGLTKDVLKNRKAKPLEKVIPKIVEAIKGKLVVTYKTFDGEMLLQVCQSGVAADFCDCFQCFSTMNPGVRGWGARTLEAAAAFYNQRTREGDKHAANEDSEICRKICMSLKERRTEPCPEAYDPVLEKARRARSRKRSR
jgi:DNA polymerase III epsilon subunit-like protein